MFFYNIFSTPSVFKRKPLAVIALTALSLIGCDSSSDDDDDSTGGLRFYNLSNNAPAIYLTVDEDLSDDDEDAFEKTYSGVDFTELSASTNIATGDYFYEIAYQTEDSSYREDLSIVLEGDMNIDSETTHLMVLNSDINSPEVNMFQIPVIDDENDDDDDLFNLRVLNMFDDDDLPNVYMSKDDETFNEAQLFGAYSYKELSDNQKFEQDTYIFYVTDPVSNEVVYESDEISFSYASQYVMVLRENTATGNSPYLLDKISNSAVVEYIDVNTDSHIRAYNAIKTHTLLPEYLGDISINLDNIDSTSSTESIAFGEFSETLTQEDGDYSIDVAIPDSSTNLMNNHLLSLPENADKTIFFYLEETNVDDDNDGDFDENNDGEIDEVAVTVNSVLVENSNSESIYDHKITLINLINHDDFDFVRFYFVRNNELISTTPNEALASFAQPVYSTLLNNTYEVYIVAQDGSSEVILHSFELVLNETSNDSFMVVQDDDSTASGYRVSIEDQ